MTLEPINPETTLELYLDQKETEVSVATLRSHRSRLRHFVRWCDDRELTNLNELTGRKIHEYRLWRRNEGELSKVSLKTQMDTLRVFIRWLGTIDAVDPELHVKVRSPDLRPGDIVREVMLDSEDAEAALEYLERYECASLPHVTLALLWHTMMRMGAAHALDVDDYSPEDQCMSVVHRPDRGTPIKKWDSRRAAGRPLRRVVPVARRLDPGSAAGRDRRLRPQAAPGDVTRPGFESAIRTYSYRYTQPCAYGEACPHGREPDDCEATRSDHVSKCPESISPHAIRRGSITHHLTSDVPETAVSDRGNVSTKVIEKHYDQRTEKEKMEQRRQYLENI